MQSKLERLIKFIYKKWKSEHLMALPVHPDEETLACFLENKLSGEENKRVRTHLISCDSCAEILTISVARDLKVRLEKNVPEELIKRAKNLVTQDAGLSLLEIVLRFKEKALEILSTTGDILVGQEFVPAPILRSRKIKDFKEEVTILKDFKDIRVEVRIENKGNQAFDLTIIVKDKRTHRIIKDLRVTLLKDNLELESYLTDLTSVTFENVLVGKYIVEISNIETKIASILLDIKT